LEINIETLEKENNEKNNIASDLEEIEIIEAQNSYRNSFLN
jgi:hypothetical protein